MITFVQINIDAIMKRSLALALLSCALFSAGISAAAQQVTVKDTVCTTYPFSDPDPVYRNGNIYPYYRFDTYAVTPVARTWKMVVLENDFLRVKVFPEIGGKVWSVYDKTSGTELFYDNDAVKFRDIALRGPWTSGGIEFNYGIIGHAPSCASPVDFSTATLPDGSVSCYVGVLDLLTRTRWTMEINLPKDKGWMRTRSFWHNAAGSFQPYYHWANSGVTAGDDLRLIYPSAYSVAHSGAIEAFPVDGQGRDLSLWRNHAFGSSKSFHPAGSRKGFFAAYWEDADAGMVHFADRDEKLGRKFFTWALSDEGDIWQELLTDARPQYVELQSGRLFNQNMPANYDTPFKQTLFSPYGTDVWEEYWAPFSGVGAIQEADMRGAARLEVSGGTVTVHYYPMRNASGTLALLDGEGKVLASGRADFRTAEPVSLSFPVPAGAQVARMTLDGVTLWVSGDRILDRPSALPEGYASDSVQEMVLRARLAVGTRKYANALKFAGKALKKDPDQLEALTLKAMAQLAMADAEGAYASANHALSVNEYDPWANYVCGEAADLLGRTEDALDRFEVAALSADVRSGAQTALARIHFREGDRERAAAYARKSLVGNAYNVTGWEILSLCGEADALDRIASLDPLCPFPKFAAFLRGDLSADALAASFQSEFPWQDYLETAAFLSDLGLKDDAGRLLAACPERNALVGLWTAWLQDDAAAVPAAEAGEIDLVFPFRPESEAPLRWAVENGGTWRSRLLLSELLDHLGRSEEAAALVKDLSDVPFAPFYGFRAGLGIDPEADLSTAARLDPGQWRYADRLARRYLAAGDPAKALSVIEPFYKKHSGQFQTTDTYVRTLMAQGRYDKADKVLSKIHILPFEGQRGSHEMYRDIKLHLAAAALDKGRYGEALSHLEASRLWPHNLGVGKPYDNMVDNRMEDWMTAVVWQRKGDTARAQEFLGRIPDADGKWADLFERAKDRKTSVAALAGNLDASFDKRLF